MKKLVKRIMFIGFPRSGHHITVKLIKDIAEKMNLPFSYCEFYNHNTPEGIISYKPPQGCTDEPCEANIRAPLITKSHDFALDVNCPTQEWKEPIPIISYQKYIVIYRDDPIIQMEAYYRFSKKLNYPDYNYQDDTYEDFQSFYKTNIDYYKAFREKWIDTKYYNVFPIRYETLINNPTETLLSILRVIYPNTFNRIDDINIKIINEVIQQNDIKYKHILTKFKYNKLRNMIR
jgi:hypothetical protein